MKLKDKYILAISSFVIVVALLVDFYNPFVVYADIFGSTIGATNGATTRIACSPFTAPASGTLTSVSAYNNASGGGNWQGAIYDSDGASNRPNTLLGNGTVDVAIPVASDWSTSTLSSSVSITSGHIYHICEWLSGATANYVYSAGAATDLATSNTTSYASWPATFGFNANSARLLRIYATYTPSGGGGGTTVQPPASMAIKGDVRINSNIIIPR